MNNTFSWQKEKQNTVCDTACKYLGIVQGDVSQTVEIHTTRRPEKPCSILDVILRFFS